MIDGNAVHDSLLVHTPLAASLVLHLMLLLALQPAFQPSDRRLAEQALVLTLDTPTASSAAPAASAAVESGGPRPRGAMDLVHTAPAPGAPDAAHSLHAAPPAPAISPPKLEGAVMPAPPPPVVTARELATEAPSMAARSGDLLDVVQAPPRRQPERQAATQPPQPKTTAPAAGRAPGEAGRKDGGASYTSRQQAQKDYVLQVVHKLSQLRFLVRSASAPGARGALVARLTVGRDGALVGLSLARDSGSAEVDGVVLETIRTAAPFAPLPKDFSDPHFSFIVPITYALER